MGLRLINRSGYDSEDLRRFVRRGLSACDVRGAVECTIVASPIRSRGCAEVGGRRMVLAIAAPSTTSKKEFLRRLARLLEHEAAHLRGVEHRSMEPDLLYSRGATPAWARGATIRYNGRAGDQMDAMKGGGGSCRSAARDFDKRALWKSIDADLRVKDREKIRTKKEALASARRSAPTLKSIRLRCGIERAAHQEGCSIATYRAREAREELLRKRKRMGKKRARKSKSLKLLRRKTPTLRSVREKCGIERAAQQEGCSIATYRAREAQEEVKRRRASLVREKKHQASLRRAKSRGRTRAPTHRVRGERQGESDDEVRSNIPRELVPMFERVRRSIHAGPRMSRTEAFMHYAEEHSSERYAGMEEKTDDLIRSLERRQRSGR